MDYNAFFTGALDRLHSERRYRVFADLERIAGRYPHAVWHSPQGPRDVVVWCSNDYLGQGQNPVVIEAMHRGVPVVASNVRGTNELVIDAETGFLVPVNDVRAFADRVGRLLLDDRLRVGMGARAIARARSEFSVARQIEAYAAVYERAVLASTREAS